MSQTKEGKGDESGRSAGSEKGLHESPERSNLHGTIASIGVSGLATGLLHAKDTGPAEASYVSPNEQSGDGDGAERRAGQCGIAILRFLDLDLYFV